jgi:hypothetical protein
MAKQGKRIPQHVRAFIEDMKRNSPGLSYSEIAELAKIKFGKDGEIDQSTVGRIVRDAGLTMSAGTNVAGTQGAERGQWVSQHWDQLSLAIEAYKQDCSLRVQGALTRADEDQVVTLPVHGRGYGDEEKRWISVIRSSDAVFENLEGSFRAALTSGDLGLANNLAQEIQDKLNGWLALN